MSENLSSDDEPQEPTISPEQQRAFRGVYSSLMLAARQFGEPTMITGVSQNNQFMTMGPEITLRPDEEWHENAKVVGACLKEADGKKHLSWSRVLNEEAASKFGRIADLEVYCVTGSHPADLYRLYPDVRIEYLKRTMVYNEQDDDSDAYGIEHVDHVAWLDVEQMIGLKAMIEAGDPLGAPN